MNRAALALLLLLAVPVAAQMSTGGGPKDSPPYDNEVCAFFDTVGDSLGFVAWARPKQATHLAAQWRRISPDTTGWRPTLTAESWVDTNAAGVCMVPIDTEQDTAGVYEVRTMLALGASTSGWETFTFAASDTDSVAIYKASGYLRADSTVTITGVNFGVKDPAAPVLWDNFEGGTNGDNIKTGAGSAAVGQWNALGSNKPYYTNEYSVSGDLALQADMASSWLGYCEVLLPEATQNVFASWWIYLPSGDAYPGEGSADRINWKTVWLQGTGTTDNDQIFPTIAGPQSLSSETQLNYCFCGNDTPYDKYISLDFRRGSWKRVWVLVVAGQAGAGKAHLWYQGSLGIVHALSDDAATIGNDGESYQRLRVNGYGRATANCHPTFDDVYVSTGDDCLARVELGDAPIYPECTVTHIQPATAWSDDSISFTFNQGTFANGESAYLYVVNADGHISGCYPVIVGTGIGPDPHPNKTIGYQFNEYPAEP